MSKNIGFLVVNRKTGYLLEGKNHAAKIFDNEPAARGVCSLSQIQVPAPISYEGAVKLLLQGMALCFDAQDAYDRFFKRLRNDPGNRTFIVYSKDKNHVRWRYSNEKNDAKTKPDARVAADLVHEALAATGPSVETSKVDP